MFHHFCSPFQFSRHRMVQRLSLRTTLPTDTTAG
jgi:hypothetical protein